ncbi:hypothetical protein [Neisseria yangbaofengii]
MNHAYSLLLHLFLCYCCCIFPLLYK